MWQAISRLLSEQLGEGEIELRNELPGGEIHAAWHLRYAGRDFFVKCDERELLTGFTAEADQLELLSRSQTVSVPKVWAVGADRDYSFLVMDFLLPVRLMRITRLFSVNSLRICTNGAINHSSASTSIMHSPLRHNPMPGSVAGQPSSPSNASAGNWNLRRKKALRLAILTPLSIMFSNDSPPISHNLLSCTAICGRQTVRSGRMAPTSLTPPVTGVTESAIWQCCRYIPINRRRFMTVTSLSRRYR